MFSYINILIEFLTLILKKLFFTIRKIVIKGMQKIINEKFFFTKKNFSFIASVFI